MTNQGQPGANVYGNTGQKTLALAGPELLPGGAVDIGSGLALVSHIVFHPGVGEGCDILYHLGGVLLHHWGVLPEAFSSHMV